MNKLAHESQKVGLASAMAIVLFVLILVATLLQKAGEWYFLGVGDQEPIRNIRRQKRIAKQAEEGGR